MKIHEYQGKQLFAAAGVPVPQGIVARTPEEAAAALRSSAARRRREGADPRRRPRQGHDQGQPEAARRPTGEVADEAATVAGGLLGKKLVTIQTGPEGQTVRRVLVEAGCDIARELYLGIVIDRAVGLPVLMASRQGGMNIEEVADEDARADLQRAVPPRRRPAAVPGPQAGARARPHAARASARPRSSCRRSASCSSTLDCSLRRNQSAGRHEDGRADRPRRQDQLRRQRPVPPPATRRAPRHSPKKTRTKLRAGKAGLSYVQLDGNIGCLVNGAGLAMSTMDLIKLHGGEPANFLDVGGGANAEQVTEAFRILLSDKNVKAVLVNIFGGIMRCTRSPAQCSTAYNKSASTCRWSCAWKARSREGRKILAESGVNIIAAKDLTDAAKKVVATLGA